MTNIYIQILEYAKANPGFTEEDLNGLFPDDFKWIVKEINNSNLFQSTSAGTGSRKYYLSFEDSFRLLEHQELKDARKSSLYATIFASSAIIISIISSAISIYYSNEQLNKPTSIESSQFDKLNNRKVIELLIKIDKNTLNKPPERGGAK